RHSLQRLKGAGSRRGRAALASPARPRLFPKPPCSWSVRRGRGTRCRLCTVLAGDITFVRSNSREPAASADVTHARDSGSARWIRPALAVGSRLNFEPKGSRRALIRFFPARPEYRTESAFLLAGADHHRRPRLDA